MSRHVVLGKAISPRVGLVAARPRVFCGHIPSAAPIKAAYAAWRARMAPSSAAYYEPALVGSANHGGAGHAR